MFNFYKFTPHNTRCTIIENMLNKKTKVQKYILISILKINKLY